MPSIMLTTNMAGRAFRLASDAMAGPGQYPASAHPTPKTKAPIISEGVSSLEVGT